MGLRHFLILITLLSSLSSEARFCSELFLSPAKLINLQEFSLRRFDPSLELTNKTMKSEIAQRWAEKIGKPVSRYDAFKKWFNFSVVTFKTVHITPDERIVVTRGSDDKLRIYTTDTDTLLTEVDTSKLVDTFFGSVQQEVIHVSNKYFILATEDSYRKSKDNEIGFDRFYPTQLFVYDFMGVQHRKYDLEQILKRVELDPNEHDLWVLTADSFYVDTVNAKDTEQHHTSFPIHYLVSKEFARPDKLVYQTFYYSEDRQYLMVGVSSRHRDDSSKVFIFEAENILTAPKIVDVVTIEENKIFKIKMLKNKKLSLLVANTSETDSAHQIIVPTHLSKP